MSLYREITILGPSQLASLVSFIKANARALIEAGTPIRVIVTTEEQKRNAEQNKYLWAAVYRDIASQAWVNGRQYSAEIWHEHYARKYGVCEDIALPNGDVIQRRKSTTQMSVKEFSEYINNVQADAAQELGVRFSA